MKAVILVGGKGTRLAPLTDVCPKPLLPVANVPFVERTLERLRQAGCDEVVLSGHYLADDFRHLEEHTGVTVRLEIEDEPLGTGGAIGYAARDFDSTFLVLNGDILSDTDLVAALKQHRSFGAEATIMLTPVDDPSRFGVVVTDDDGRVDAFIEKPEPGTAPSNMINAGLYVCEPEMLARIPSGRAVSIERETFPAMVDDGALFGLGSDAYWLDFGTIATYLQANLDVLDARVCEPVPEAVAPDARVARTARIEEPVVIADGSQIGESCEIGPRVAIGPGCSVGDGARIRDSVLLDGCSVGPGAEIAGAIVGAGAAVAEGSRLEEGDVVAPADDPAGEPKGR